ncbi:MAG: NifB/NifX family molybdenum-iron cluster-binding protein [Candidatus Altiarchaeota archaeon]|nr:NifB/NifX family molybdenum-iron cluster-binding protein [Candidatus Altiarchaeota archaeon]
MKIAVATNKGGLDDNVFPNFGRCTSFTILEVEGADIKNVQVVQNEFSAAGGGSGIRTAQFLADQGVEAVIAGNFGPNAFGILNQAGIRMVQGQGVVRDAVAAFAKGELKPIDSATGPVYGGLGGGGSGRGGGGRGGFGRGGGGRR